VLRVRTDSPLIDTARFGEVPSVDAVATYDEETGKLAVFLVNRSVDGPVELTVDTGRTPGDRRTGGTRRARCHRSREPR
jgi:alpha-N-arabinofuranosidase